MRSSYIENNYGDVFYRNVVTYRPRVVVELGVLDGYSTLHIAKGLKYVKEFYNEPGHLYAYDLFDDYEFNHGNQEEVQSMLEKEGVAEYVTLEKEDAFNVYTKYKPESVELLHVDLSNTGDIVDQIIDQWAYIVSTQGGRTLVLPLASGYTSSRFLIIVEFKAP